MRGSYVQQQGALALQEGSVIISSITIGASASLQAALQGRGYINGNLVVYATVSVGNSPGVVYLDCFKLERSFYLMETKLRIRRLHVTGHRIFQS